MPSIIGEEFKYSKDYQCAATHPGVLGARQAEPMTRTEMHRRLNQRCNDDASLRQALFDHPRAIYAVAVEECFGIHRSLFFVQIDDVEVIREDRFTLGVVVSACHLACIAPRLPTGQEHAGPDCHICTHLETTGQHRDAEPALPTANRAAIRDWVQTLAKHDETFLRQLKSSPAAAWSQVLGRLDLPAGDPIHEIRTIHLHVETARTIGLVPEYLPTSIEESQCRIS